MAAAFGGQISRAGMAAKQVCAQAEGGGPGGRHVLQVGAEGIAHQLADGAAFLGAALAQLMFQLGGQLDGGGHGGMDPDRVIRMVLPWSSECKKGVSSALEGLGRGQWLPVFIFVQASGKLFKREPTADFFG